MINVSQHPYAVRKGITHPFGAGRGVASGSVVGQDADCLLIPIRPNGIDEPIAVQAINADGKKQTYGTIADGFLLLGDERDTSAAWFAVEGWATAHAVRHALRHSVVLISFGKGRLQKVAQLAADLYHPDQITILSEAA